MQSSSVTGSPDKLNGQQPVWDIALCEFVEQNLYTAVVSDSLDQLGVRDPRAGVALRATFVIDPDNVIQHVSVNNLNVGRNPAEVLRVLDGLQTDELCPCNRQVGGKTL